MQKKVYDFLKNHGIIFQVWENEYHKWNTDVKYSENCDNFMAHVIHHCEYVFDFDEAEKEKNKQAAKKIIGELKKRGYKYILCDTGGRGYHIHLYFIDEETKKFFKTFAESILKINGIKNDDALLKSKIHLITAFFAQHRKTKNTKVILNDDFEVMGEDEIEKLLSDCVNTISIADVETAKLFLRKPVKILLKKYFLELIDVDPTTGEVAHDGYVYIASFGHNTEEFFVWANEQLFLGWQEIHLEKTEPPPLRETYVNAFLKHKPTSAKIKQTKRMDQDMSFFDATKHVLMNETVWYKKTHAVPKEFFKYIDDEFLQECIDEYICGGFDIDERIQVVMRAGLLQVENPTINFYLAKYMPHALIIKNPKTGVSSISQRIGVNIDTASFPSLEGYATADGDVNYSLLHNAAGHVNFDEFLMMDDKILQKCFNYLELGKYTTIKATQKIENLGCARITFTANPTGLPRREINEYNNIQEVEPPEAAAFKRAVMKLTEIVDAAFSRVGVIVFDVDLKEAQKKQIDVDELRIKNNIAKAAVYYAQKNTTQILKDAEWFLEKEIVDYSVMLDDYCNKTTDILLQEAFAGQKNAYRHIRGGGLLLTCLDNLKDVICSKYDFLKLINDAEYNTRLLYTINNTSFEKILQYVKEDNITQIYENFESDKEYVKIFKEVLKFAIKQKKTNIYTFEELKRCLDTLREKNAIETNSYGLLYWLNLEKNITKERFIRKVKIYFKKNLIINPYEKKVILSDKLLNFI